MFAPLGVSLEHVRPARGTLEDWYTKRLKVLQSSTTNPGLSLKKKKRKKKTDVDDLARLDP